MMAKDAIEQWWEDSHEDANYYISDYGGWYLWRTMNIVRFVRPFRRVLEIGVGGGKDIKWLNRIRCKVSALDISETALEKVRGIAKDGWTDPEFLPDNAFDIAISHLVTQHIDNATLER
jgi:2-polyprenyl-3-methyl-5-hydroxy-6-metoxy-1,4-benzoquinol methylase